MGALAYGNYLTSSGRIILLTEKVLERREPKTKLKDPKTKT